MKHELFKLEHTNIYAGDSEVFHDFNIHIYAGHTLRIICSNVSEEQSLTELFLGNCKLEDLTHISSKYQTRQERLSAFRRFFVVDEKLNLVPYLSIAENICLFSSLHTAAGKKRISSMANELIEHFQINFDINRPLSSLKTWETIVIMLLKGYSERRSIIVLNSMTDFITDSERQIIDSIIDKMLHEGYSFVLIGSTDNQVYKSADEVLIIKNQTSVACFDYKFIDSHVLYKYMYPERDHRLISGIIENNHDETEEDFKPYIIFDHVSTDTLNDISFDVTKGELLKILCLDRKTVDDFRYVINGKAKLESGNILIDNVVFRQTSGIGSCLDQHVAWIPESPYKNAILKNLSVMDNLLLTLSHKVSWIWNRPDFTHNVRQFLESFAEISSPEDKAYLFSPEKLQKVAYARYLITAPKIIFVENPFVETDLQMQETTIRMLNLLVRRGITVIVLMSSYSSLQLISGDEIYVKNGKQITEDELYQILYSMPYNEQ